MLKCMRLSIILLSLALTGCVVTPSESGYYWGTYSQTYSEYLKEPSQENVQNHFNTLLDIVEVSDRDGLKCPPGIYAELGYISQKLSKKEDALAYFEKEVDVYPESRQFIEILIQKGE